MGAFQAVGTLMQGDAAQAAGNYNADTASYNATAAQDEGGIRLQQQQTQAARTIGQARAAYGASGVDSTQGSALQVLKQSAAQAALDSISIQNQTAAKVLGYQRTSQLDRFQGNEAQTASQYTAAGQLVGSMGQLAGG